VEGISVPIYRKGDKTDFSHHKGILLLPTTYKMKCYAILLSMYVDKGTGNYHYGF